MTRRTIRRKTWARPQHGRPTRRGAELRLEPLEEHTVLSTFTIANGDLAGLIAAIHTADTNNHNNTIALAAGAATSSAQ